jgi:hypothetical protein
MRVKAMITRHVKRITFQFQGEDAEIVDYEDYH